MDGQTTNTVVNTARTVGTAGIGGASYYLYNVSKGKPFNFIMFCINIFLAGFVGYIVQGMLPTGFTMIGPVSAMSGFSAFPILAIIEAKFPDLFEKYINNIK